METLTLYRSAAESKASAIAIEKKNGHILTPSVSERMEDLNTKSKRAAKQFPDREHPMIHDVDFEFCIEQGVVTNCCPADKGRTRVTISGIDKLATCRLFVYLVLPPLDSLEPLIIEGFGIGLND